MKDTIKAIIFDLGNVLIDFDHWIAVKKLSAFMDKDPQEAFNLFFDSELTCLFEEGKISPQKFFLKIKKILNLKLDYATFLPIWNDIFFLTPKNIAVYNLAKQLKNRYRLAVLSNINVLHFDYLKKKFSVFDVFHHIITSYENGVRKPHPLIYKKALDFLSASAYEVFYTDDRPLLTEGAKQLGIRGFVFKGIEQLKKDLINLGVKIN